MEVEKLRREFEVQVEWLPYFLRPETPPEGLPLPAYVRERMKDPNNPLELRARAAGLKMVQRELIPSTRRAHEVAEFARAHGQLETVHAALLRRYWSEGQDLWAWDTLRGAVQEAGLDADEMQRAVEEGRYRDTVEGSIREARELGIAAVPTFLLADRYVIQGAQDYRVFRQAMERLGAKPRAAS